MDHLRTPWRYRYVTGSGGAPGGPEGCAFCWALARSGIDQETLVVHRGEHNFVLLNRYPYTSGHMLLVPHAHVATLAEVPEAAAAELMLLTRRAERLLRRLYVPDGINLGMNIGRAAGASVVGHVHMHALPRWMADANFVSVLGETRVLPEELPRTWARLRDAFRAEAV